ncbi:Transcription factor skn7, partial [Globisporangium splendens]
MAAGIATGFVRKLYRILDLESDAIISWDPAGRSFSIHDAEQLNERVLPRYFRGRLCAFRQQLVDHGFEQLECEDNETREVYRHDHFLQGCPGQLSLIKRVPKPKRKAATVVPSAVSNGVLQVPTRAPSPLTVTLSAGSISGIKRISPSATAGGSDNNNALQPNKRLRMEPPLTVTVTNTATANGGGVHNSRTTGIANTNPLFSNEPDAGVLSFARLAESGLLPCSSDLPEPISYLTKMTQAAATASNPAQQQIEATVRSSRSLTEPPMFSDDLFRSALFFLASTSTSTTGTTDPMQASNGTAPAGAQDNNDIKTGVDKNGNVSVSANLLAMLMASSTSGMPPAGASTSNGGSTWSSNPLFSDQSTGDDDDNEDSIWNLLVASSIDRVKSAMVDGQTPQQRLKMILDERERLEEQRKKFTRGAAAATTNVGTSSASTTDGVDTTNTQPSTVQKKPLNPLFAAKTTTTRASNPVAPPKAAVSLNPLFAEPSSVNPLFTKPSSSVATATATSNPLFAKTATTTTSAGAAGSAPTTSNPLFAKASGGAATVAPRANPHEDDLWRLLMSSSIDSFRRVGEFEV